MQKTLGVGDEEGDVYFDARCMEWKKGKKLENTGTLWKGENTWCYGLTDNDDNVSRVGKSREQRGILGGFSSVSFYERIFGNSPAFAVHSCLVTSRIYLRFAKDELRSARLFFFYTGCCANRGQSASLEDDSARKRRVAEEGVKFNVPVKM